MANVAYFFIFKFNFFYVDFTFIHFFSKEYTAFAYYITVNIMISQNKLACMLDRK